MEGRIAEEFAEPGGAGRLGLRVSAEGLERIDSSLLVAVVAVGPVPPCEGQCGEEYESDDCREPELQQFGAAATPRFVGGGGGEEDQDRGSQVDRKGEEVKVGVGVDRQN